MLDKSTRAIIERFLWTVDERQQVISAIMVNQTSVKNFLQLLTLQIDFQSPAKDDNTRKMIEMLELTHRQVDLMAVVISDFTRANASIRTLLAQDKEVTVTPTSQESEA